MKWIDLAAMSEEERADFAWRRSDSVLATEFRIGPPLAADGSISLLAGYFVPDPGGSVLILPLEVRDSPYVVKPAEDEADPGQRRWICRFHTGVNDWKGSRERTRFPVTLSWDTKLEAVVARLWNDPHAEQFILYFDTSPAALAAYVNKKYPR